MSDDGITISLKEVLEKRGGALWKHIWAARKYLPEWKRGRMFREKDLCVRDGVVYVCKSPHVGDNGVYAPTKRDTAYWAVINYKVG